MKTCKKIWIYDKFDVKISLFRNIDFSSKCKQIIAKLRVPSFE